MKKDEIFERYEVAKSERQSFWDPLWQHCADYAMPRKSQILAQKSPGVDDYTQDLYDATTGDANRTLAAGIMTYSAPPNDRWFSFDPPPALIKRGLSSAGIEWFQSCTRRVALEIARSNFHSEMHEAMLERSLFGTCAIGLFDGRASLLQFRCLTVASYVIIENDEGIVDTVVREYQLSVRNMVKRFGVNALPSKIQKLYKTGGRCLDEEFTILHSVYPREDQDRDSSKIDPLNKPFASCYYLKEGKHLLLESGMDESPIAVGRFLTWPGEVYGYGPGVDALPLGRQVNHIEKSMDALAELKAFPRTLVPENLDGDVDLRAAGVTIFDPNNPNALPREWLSQGEYDIGLERVSSKEKKIRRAFHNELFQMLADVEPGKATAYEISVRESEKLTAFSPTFKRIDSELYSPLLLRAFAMCYRAGLFDDPPEDVFIPTLNGVALAQPQVALTGLLALKLKQIENRATMETITTLAPIVQVEPSVLDVFDLDAVAIGIARNNGMPPEFVRDPEEVAELRAQRAQAAAQAQAMAAAESASKSAANLGKAPPGLRDAMVGGMAG